MPSASALLTSGPDLKALGWEKNRFFPLRCLESSRRNQARPICRLSRPSWLDETCERVVVVVGSQHGRFRALGYFLDAFAWQLGSALWDYRVQLHTHRYIYNIIYIYIWLKPFLLKLGQPPPHGHPRRHWPTLLLRVSFHLSFESVEGNTHAVGTHLPDLQWRQLSKLDLGG